MPSAKRDTARERVLLLDWVRTRNVKARNALIVMHMPFCHGTARIYASSGVPHDDLVSSAVLGFTEALDRVDIHRTNCLLTFAVWYLRRRILLDIAEQSRLYRLSQNAACQYYRYRRSEDRLVQRHRRKPTPQEIASDTGDTDTSCALMHDVVDRTSRSLYDPTPDSETVLVIDTLRSRFSHDDIAGERRAVVKEALDHLSARERDIVVQLYRYDNGPERTLEDLARTHGITRERVRQIKEKAEETLVKWITKRGYNIAA